MCNSAISTTYDVKTTKLKESLSFCNWEWPSKKGVALWGLEAGWKRWKVEGFKGKVLKYWVKKGVKTKFNAF